MCATHDFRIGWCGRLSFHLSRASISVFDIGLALQEDSKTNQHATKSASETCFDSFPWLAIRNPSFYRFGRGNTILSAINNFQSYHIKKSVFFFLN